MAEEECTCANAVGKRSRATVNSMSAADFTTSFIFGCFASAVSFEENGWSLISREIRIGIARSRRDERIEREGKQSLQEIGYLVLKTMPRSGERAMG